MCISILVPYIRCYLELRSPPHVNLLLQPAALGMIFCYCWGIQLGRDALFMRELVGQGGLHKVLPTPSFKQIHESLVLS